MQSLRIGTDIVSVERVGRLIERRGSRFLTRWFSEAEISYCLGKSHPEQHFAARLAAKESVVKVLRLPWDGPIPYRNVEIASDPTGATRVRLSGRVATAAALEGLGPIEVSLSHCAQYAVAFAMTNAGAVMSPRGEHL